MPNKSIPTETDINNQLRFIGKVIKEYYLNKTYSVILYIYILIIELTLSKLAVESKTLPNLSLMKDKFGNSISKRAYMLRNRLVHNVETFTSCENAIDEIASLGYDFLTELEVYSLGMNVHLFTDILIEFGYIEAVDYFDC